MTRWMLAVVVATLGGLGCGDESTRGGDTGSGLGSDGRSGGRGGSDDGASGGTRGGTDAIAGSGATSGSGGTRDDAGTGDDVRDGGDRPVSGRGGGGGMGAGQGGADGPPVVEGWTDFEMQPGAQVIYVSSSGDDAAEGTMAAPKATLEGAYAAVRDGEPDWVLLRRGDEWTRGQVVEWFKSGPLADDAGYMRIGAYGDESLPRPRIDTGVSSGLVLSPGFQAARPLTHVAVTDLHFVAAGRIAAGAAAALDVNGIHLIAVQYTGPGAPLRSVVIENVKLEGFQFGIISGNDAIDLRIRRSILTNIFMPGGDGTHCSGILSSATDLLIEDNVFYRIQHPDNPAVTAISNMAHSAYLAAEGRNVVTRGNIVIKATEGFMQRPGGVFERNVAVSTQIAHLTGQAWGVTPTAGGVTATIHDNLLLNAGANMILGNTASGSVLRNLVVRGPEGSASTGIDLISENAQGTGLNVGVHDTAFEDNVVSGAINYDAVDTTSFSGLTFANNRTDLGAITTSIADFVSSVGLEGDLDDYAADLVARDRGNFTARHLSTAMLDFYREPEDLPALD